MLLLGSCSEDTPTTNTTATPKKQIVEEDTIDWVNSKLPYLTTGNAPELLAEYGPKHPETKVILKTEFGDIKMRLYNETPMHRANFIMLVKRGYFTGNYFYRIAKGHVIQGGNTDKEETEFKRMSIGGYSINHEILPQFHHKKGALAAARDYTNNPTKKTDPYNFYIVQGSKYTVNQLKTMEREHGTKFNDTQIEHYMQTGGSPHLDGKHTVFGEVYEGFAVIDRIAEMKVDRSEWPVNDVVFDIEILE